MTQPEFVALGVGSKWPFEELYSPLIDGNDALMGEGRAVGSTTHPTVFDRLTEGQRALFALAVFDGQVCNGGLTQFFWNYPELIEAVGDGLELIGDTDLGTPYGRAIDQITARLGPWKELRAAAYADQAKPDWEPFRQSYELLDLGGFDDEYFDTRHWPEGGGAAVVTQVGLGKKMLERLEAWVRSHPDEFIRPPDGDLA